MSEKINIHTHPQMETDLGIGTGHFIIDAALYHAILKKYGDHFDPDNRCGACGCFLSKALCTDCLG